MIFLKQRKGFESKETVTNSIIKKKTANKNGGRWSPLKSLTSLYFQAKIIQFHLHRTGF